MDDMYSELEIANMINKIPLTPLAVMIDGKWKAFYNLSKEEQELVYSDLMEDEEN